MNLEIEIQIVNSFFIKNKRERAILELANPKKRRLFIATLSDKLDHTYFHRVEDKKNIYQTLKELGAPNSCYIISCFEEVDGREFELRHGLRILDYEFEFMSCIPGKLAFFRKTPSESYILIR